MTDTVTDTGKKKRRRRMKWLSGSLKINMSLDMIAALEAVAERAEIPVSEAVRQCIERGLPAFRQSLRPSRRPGGAK